jgi:hypothetical protein
VVLSVCAYVVHPMRRAWLAWFFHSSMWLLA